MDGCPTLCVERMREGRVDRVQGFCSREIPVHAQAGLSPQGRRGDAQPVAIAVEKSVARVCLQIGFPCGSPFAVASPAFCRSE